MPSSITRISQNWKPSSVNLLGSITQISEESRLIDQISEYSQILHFMYPQRISSCYTTVCPALWILWWLSFRNCRGAVPPLLFVAPFFSCSYSLVSYPVPYHPPPSNYISTTGHSFSINHYFFFTNTFFETTPLKVGLWNHAGAVNEFSLFLKTLQTKSNCGCYVMRLHSW